MTPELKVSPQPMWVTLAAWQLYTGLQLTDFNWQIESELISKHNHVALKLKVCNLWKLRIVVDPGSCLVGHQSVVEEQRNLL